MLNVEVWVIRKRVSICLLVLAKDEEEGPSSYEFFCSCF